MPDIEDFERAGLYPGDGDPAARRQLLEWLTELGFGVEELTTPVARENLAAIASDHRILPGRRMGREEALARSGIEPERFDRLAMAFGLVPLAHDPPGELRYTEGEVELLASLSFLTPMFSDDEAVSVVRVLGSLFARLGEAVVSMFLADVESPHLKSGEDELALAHKIYEASGLLDGLAASLDPILRRHVLQAIERGRRATFGEERLLYRYAIGFVDLVGFTPLTSDLSAPELGAFVRSFEARAHDVATTSGARVVKVIGDEVMLASPEPTAACRAAHALMHELGERDRGVIPRGGLAYGDVLTRGGDYYGSVVNVASRLVDHAVPGEVLVTEAVTKQSPGCIFDVAGRRLIKGFADPVEVWTLRTVD